MPLLTPREADERYENATTTLRVAKRTFEKRGSRDLVDAQLPQTVVDWLSAIDDRIASYKQHLDEKVHEVKTLSDEEAKNLNRMLTEIAREFFPAPGGTLVDDERSLEARVTGLDAFSPKLTDLRSRLVEARREIAILIEWYDWYREQTTHHPGGMFDAIRQKHDITQRCATRLEDVADAFRGLREQVAPR